MPERPLFIVLSGPNGAGKSKAASALIGPSVTFVNADEIAKTLPGYPSPRVDLEAGRIAWNGWTIWPNRGPVSRSRRP